jgi:hypothetical protein
MHTISVPLREADSGKSQAYPSRQQPDVAEHVLSGCSPGVLLRNSASGTSVRFNHRGCGGIAPEIQSRLCGHLILFLHVACLSLPS